MKEASAASAAGHDVSVVYSRHIPRLYAADASILAEHPEWDVSAVEWAWEGAGGRLRRVATALRERAAGAVYRRTGGRGAAVLAHARTHSEMYRLARRAPADLYVAHNLEALPAAARAAARRGAALGFDAEDFHRGEMADVPENREANALRAQIEAWYLPRCDYVTAASEGIARAYAGALGTEPPAVVLNVFPLAERDVPVPAERAAAEKPDGARSLFWFSQTIGPGRGLEDALAALPLLPDDVVLSLCGTWASGYERALMQRAESLGVAGRVRALPTVPPSHLIPLASRHDVGLALERTAPVNRDLCLTNKLFTYLTAGLPAVATDTTGQRSVGEAVPEAVRLVPIGDPPALAEAAASLLEAGERARRAASAAAESRYNWEAEQDKLLALVGARARWTGASPRECVGARWRGGSVDVKRVLIVSPSFPPVNAADMHRVRQSLPYLAEFGWEATVLAVEPDLVEGNRDPLLLETVPPGADVRHVGALDYRKTRRVGLGSLALRSLPFYHRAGSRLLASGVYDLVYFSTTMFPVMVLGAYWKRRFGVPFVLDIQDPWHSEYYTGLPKEKQPPKYWFAYRLHKYTEPVAMRAVDAVVAVSAAYCETLQARYENVRPGTCATIPFGGPAADFDVLDRAEVENPVFDLDDGLVHAVYAGRGGADMELAARGFFQALRWGLGRRPDLFEPVRLHFVGTQYADGGPPTLAPLAADYGVADRVDERPDRVPYFTALRLLRDADLLLVPGSDDPAYTASKLYPYILSGRPILAAFNEQSSVIDVLRTTRAGEAVTFAADAAHASASADQVAALADRLLTAWTGLLERLPAPPDTDWEAFEPYTAREMTRRQVEVFDRVTERTTP